MHKRGAHTWILAQRSSSVQLQQLAPLLQRGVNGRTLLLLLLRCRRSSLQRCALVLHLLLLHNVHGCALLAGAAHHFLCRHAPQRCLNRRPHCRARLLLRLPIEQPLQLRARALLAAGQNGGRGGV